MSDDATLTVLQPAAGEVQIFRNVEDLSHAASRFFLAQAVEAVRARGRFTVALSGGSTPKKLYSLLATPSVAKEIPWNHVHLFWGDERCVSPDAPDSNYGMVREVLLRKVSIPAGNVHRIRGEVQPGQAAAEYEALLRQFFDIPQHRWPRFDLALMGLGEDGHTASLFPGSPALEERERLAVASYVEQLRAYRVTVTLPVFNHAAALAFLVAGERKQSIVTRVLWRPEKEGPLPARRIRPVDGKLLWFLDQAAADVESTAGEVLAESSSEA